MSTTSTVITLAICAVLVVSITIALVKGLWVASKKIVVPVQVVLFVVMLVCVGRMLFTKENAKKLYDGIEQSGVSQNMENTVRSALNMKQAEKPVATTVAEPTSSVPPAPVAAAPAAPAPVAAAPVETPAPIAVAPTSAPAPVASVPAQVVAATPVSVSEPASEIKPDYSRFDKGKKSFSYALPFGAQVKVGFRDGTYRLIAESLGELSASEKKEIGKMVMNALSEYSGEKVTSLDKSQVTFNVKYDAAANQTRVFVTVPPSAIE